MRRALFLAAAIGLAGCSTQAQSAGASAAAKPEVSRTPAASPTTVSQQDAIAGPGGMTLAQEIGAVMMVGFKGPLTAAVHADWRQHQFGGLLVEAVNQNAQDPTAIRALIQSLRDEMAHPLLAAADQEGGTVCFLETRVPCLAGARQAGSQGPGAIQAEMMRMSTGLKALGFDINLAPVADVWDGAHPIMSERSYGQNPHVVAQDVTAAIAGIHAAGMYSAARHFPGQGSANGDSAVQLPLVGESAATLRAQDFVPFRAAVAGHTDFVMIGNLEVPALDSSAPSSMSASVIQLLRTELGYQGMAISDDLLTGALGPRYPPPAAAVRFLSNGGDMVTVAHDLQVADATYDAIHAAVLDGSYSRLKLDASVQKLLNLRLRFMP